MAFDGFVPVITERRTGAQHRNDDSYVFADAAEPESVKSIVEPGLRGRENALIKKEKR